MAFAQLDGSLDITSDIGIIVASVVVILKLVFDFVRPYVKGRNGKPGTTCDRLAVIVQQLDGVNMRQWHQESRDVHAWLQRRNSETGDFAWLPDARLLPAVVAQTEALKSIEGLLDANLRELRVQREMLVKHGRELARVARHVEGEYGA